MKGTAPVAATLFALSILLHPLQPDAKDLGTKTGAMWSPCIEWTIQNPSHEGNPFDLVARVTFEHESGRETRLTEMYYDGDDRWKFRFTGTRVGKWKFHTESDDPDLNGHTGAVVVEPNADPNTRGFLIHKGNRFAVHTGNDARLEGYVFNVYMDGVKFLSRELVGWNDAKTRAYCDAARENGFEIVFFHLNNNWFKLGALGWNEHDSRNPDLETFRLLDRILTIARQRGCRVHFWAWGDESRKWTPKGVGGINGPADRRLQRYIAARLGPLPGWSMGYGFDLHEWTTPKQLNSWAQFMHDHFGWQHLLCARGQPLQGANNVNSYDGFGRTVPLTTTAHGPRDYAEIVEDLDCNKKQPHLYEERHSYLRKGFSLDMDGTRRLLWWETMAGGMGGFFGFYNRSSSAFVEYPYANPEQLRTHYIFWHTKNRFRLDMRRRNEPGPGGAYVLCDPLVKTLVLYKEDTRSIEIDLSGLLKDAPALAVDTKSEYREIELGALKPGKQTIRLPRASDWAVAIGEF